jgi:hypothetical protein
MCSQMHRERPIKVTAWVDEGVVALVEALNEWHEVVTLDSCEGDEATGASVFFAHRGGSQEAASCAALLGEALGAHTPPLPFRLRAEWREGDETPVMELVCPRDAVDVVAAAVSSCRTKASDGGT